MGVLSNLIDRMQPVDFHFLLMFQNSQDILIFFVQPHLLPEINSLPLVFINLNFLD